MADVTQILNAIESGNADAAEQLFPLVYGELRRLAAQKMAQEKPGQTLQATALVHEVYLRLVTNPQREQGTSSRHWNSRGHFFAAAAEAMRRILVENARRKHAGKRGGGRRRVDFRRAEHVAAAPPEDLLALDEALERLTRHDANAGQLVKLRYFAGLSMEQAADILGLSRAQAYRLYTFARAWLRVQAAGDSESSAHK